jgi:hypothetical protein
VVVSASERSHSSGDAKSTFSEYAGGVNIISGVRPQFHPVEERFEFVGFVQTP